MPTTEDMPTTTSLDFTTLAKGLGWSMELLAIILPVLYVIFAFIILKQTKLMVRSFDSPLSSLLRTIARVHFMVAVAVAIFAVISLF